MYVHIALYRWKASATPGRIKTALEGVKTLADKVPGVVEISWGENTSKYSDGYTHVILVQAENQAAIDAYRQHPDHEKVAKEKEIETMEDHGIGVDFTPQ